MNSTYWQVLPSNQFTEIQNSWDKLNFRNNNQAVLTSNFVQSLLNTFASSELVLVCKYKDKDLVFAGFFEPVSKYRWRVFQASQGPLGVFIVDGGKLDRTLINEIALQLPSKPWLIDFTQIDSACYASIANDLDMMHYITTGALDIPQDFEQYFASFSKNTRQNVNKAKNRLKKEGVERTLLIIDKPVEMAKYVALYGELESKGWKNALGTAVHADNEQGQFYIDMLTSMAEQGNAQIWCYQFDDKIVAIDLCVIHQKTLTILKTTFDEEYARYSPALLLKLDAYKAFSEQGTISRIEYYGKVMDWHRRLTCQERPLFHVTWARSQGVYRLLNWLKQKIKSSSKSGS